MTPCQISPWHQHRSVRFTSRMSLTLILGIEAVMAPCTFDVSVWPLDFIEGLFCFIYYKVLSEITTFVLFIVQSRFLFLFFVVTYQIFFQSHLHVYYQVIILWMIFSIFYQKVISITFEVLKRFIIWWFCWLILIFWIKSFFFRKTLKYRSSQTQT